MQPAHPRSQARGDKNPIVIQTNPKKQPVNPGAMIWNQKHRAGRLQSIQVVSAEAENDLEQKTQEHFHDAVKCIIGTPALQTKFALVMIRSTVVSRPSVTNA